MGERGYAAVRPRVILWITPSTRRTSPMIQLQILGPVELRRDGVEVRSVLAQPKRLALLAYLAAAAPRGFHARDSLLALFWPESDGDRARNSLRQGLHYLRRSLGDDAVVGRGDREVGVDPQVLWCDAAAFDQAVKEGRDGDALALYRGDLLPGFFVEDAPEVERWIDTERDRLRRPAVAAAWRLADAELARGEPRAAAPWARRAVALLPADEGGIRRLLAVLEAAGEPAAALEAFGEFARRMESEYGLAPSPETAALAERLRAPVDVSASPARDGIGPASAPAAPASSEDGAASAVNATPVILPVSTSATSSAPPIVPTEDVPSATMAAERREGAKRGFRIPRLGLRAAAAIAVLLGLGAGAGWYGRSRPAEPEAAPSIAVLPFVNMSGDPAREYFSDGITEELLNVLTRVPGLQVAARTSSFSFKGRNLPVDSIGRVLKVAHVLEGSVRMQDGRVRITAQLIDASTGYHLWSETYDRELRDVFAVQDEISRAIVQALRVEMEEDGATTLARVETADPEAHSLALRGQAAIRGGTEESLARAAALYEEAIRRDARYARAYAGLANAYQWQAYMGHVPEREGYTRARATAERALALDPRLGEAYVVLGRVSQALDRDLTRADEHFRRALALNPRDPRVHSRRAEVLMHLGRVDEAIASARRAVELDPVSPAELSALSSMLASADRYDEALEVNAQALRFQPDHPVLLGNRALQLSKAGRHADAVTTVERVRALQPDDPALPGTMAYVYARAGRRAQALAAAREFETGPAVSWYGLANTYLELNEREKSIGYLEKSFEAREQEAWAVADDPTFAPLLAHPAMQRLLTRIKAAQP